MAELLLELLSEEIPARMQARAADDLQRLVTDALKHVGLTFKTAEAFVTPRRLALVVDGLPAKTKDISEERRGPRADAPDKAVDGFLRSNGLKKSDLEVRETDKGSFYFATIDRKGTKAEELLPDLLEGVLTAMPWPKSMRWADRSERWVRPLQGILCILDGRIVSLSFAGIDSGNKTAGHRFLAPKQISVANFEDYKKKLKTAKVLLDPVERKAKILKDAQALAKKAGLTLNDDPALLDEVTGLVEWPVVYLGAIDGVFMDLPPEVLTTSMRAHQKYFALSGKDGKLASHFVVVANTVTDDEGKAVVAGNERVLRARLSDAQFYWDQDRKQTLSSRAPALKDITFHAKLGTIDDKIDRVQSLAAEIAGHVSGAGLDKVRSAARLAKADLTAGMVYEFPELQGVMGRYYALKDGEDAAVADAIRDHYSPLGPSDDCPTAPISVTVALADKIDTLVGFWAIDEKPTGSRDPYALRRAALGVIRLVLENKLRLPLLKLFDKAILLYRDLPNKSESFDGDDLLAFFADRLKVHLREQGVRHDLISAVFALGGEDDLVRLMARVTALDGFLVTKDGANLLTAYKRAANILRIEEKKDGTSFGAAVDAKILSDAEEKVLFDRLMSVESRIVPILKAERFDDAMAAFAELREPVDEFFNEVTVNCDDAALRVNRLRLLSRIRTTMNRVADFSKIEGGER